MKLSLFSKIRVVDKLAEASNDSKRSPLEDVGNLTSHPDKGCEFSTATSGTERERGFVGIVTCRSVPLWV